MKMSFSSNNWQGKVKWFINFIVGNGPKIIDNAVRNEGVSTNLEMFV